MRIAMWSGPRNLSTAMMYAFAARGDCAVWDEPFYAPYLALSGADHPMRDAILAASETDPRRVADRCVGAIPNDRPHFYMKQMPHHMVEGIPVDWASACVNVHLIRHPARVIASYARKREAPTLEDIGFAQQSALYERFPGPVLDSDDIRRDPEAMLRTLCAEIGLPFRRAMLSWPAGGIAEDGPWASHWYGAVHRSTGFAGAEGPLPDVADQDLLSAALPYYAQLRDKRLGLTMA